MERILKKLSVIIPVYNAEKTLKRCMESVLKQKDEDLEIVLINDGSTDASDKIIQEYKEKNPKIISYYKKKNTGVADTRNYGIKKARGEFIGFSDADDMLAPNAMELYYNKITEGDYDMVISQYYRVVDGKDYLSTDNDLSEPLRKETDYLSSRRYQLPSQRHLSQSAGDVARTKPVRWFDRSFIGAEKLAQKQQDI